MNSSLKRLLLLFPFLYLLHDIEEIVTVEEFLRSNSLIIPIQVTTEEFTLAFTLLWILASIGCFQAYSGKRFLKMKPTTYLSFLVPGILLANGMGHLFQFIFFKGYVPGIITTILILFPYSFFTVKFLFTEKLLTIKRFLSYVIVGFFLQIPLALLAHFISNIIFTFF